MAQTTSKITVTYSIDPPDGVDLSSSLKKDSTIEVDVSGPSSTDENAGYYENLRSALAEAKARVGAELTAWRDAVGSLENAKEKKKASKTDSDEDIDEEEIEE